MPALQAGSLLLASVAAVLFALYWGSTSHCPATRLHSDSQLPTGYLGYECAAKPHHSSWQSWWHPERSDEKNRAARGQDAGTTDDDWNILYHLGGNGPWVEKVIDVVEGGIAVPEGCDVEQVHMVGFHAGFRFGGFTDNALQMSRHAERYPTKTAGKSEISTSFITFHANSDIRPKSRCPAYERKWYSI
jgi:acid phosphatase